MRDVTFNTIGLGEEEVDSEVYGFFETILRLFFFWQVTEATPYDFYDGLDIANKLQ